MMTAIQTIDACRQIGAVLLATDAGLICRAVPGSLPSELQTALRSNRDGIRTILLADGNTKKRPEPSALVENVSRSKAGWSLEIGFLTDFALLLTPGDLPETPFAFGPGCTVVDRDKFLASLRLSIAQGPLGPKARYGTIQADLLRLRDILLAKSD